MKTAGEIINPVEHSLTNYSELPEAIQEVLTSYLPQVENVEYANARLIQAHREDLIITNRAEMIDIHLPELMIAMPPYENIQDLYGKFGNNFAQGFRIHGSRIGTFVKHDELRKMINGEIIPRPQLTHIHKPALLRMGTLFPNFTEDLILGMSQGELEEQKRNYMYPLFIAHKLMRNLVDEDDFGVKIDGTVNKGYLLGFDIRE